jgi:hypothetical protein
MQEAAKTLHLEPLKFASSHELQPMNVCFAGITIFEYLKQRLSEDVGV